MPSTPDYELQEKVVLITGAGAGIGKATAAAFHALGAHVVITDLDGEAAELAAAELGGPSGRAFGIRLDVADEHEVEAVVRHSLSQCRRIDVLVNNAGIGARVPTTELPSDRWAKALDVGLGGTFYCCRAVGRHMVDRRRGTIVNVSSIMGLSGGGLYPNLAYHAAKGALVNMTRALALEWAPFGIRVNAVAPAFTRTALVEPLLSDPAMMKAILDATPLGRLVEPAEVAAAITFLAGNAASMITGHILPIDGGWLAR